MVFRLKLYDDAQTKKKIYIYIIILLIIFSNDIVLPIYIVYTYIYYILNEKVNMCFLLSV